ncbi:hypothetical protein ASC94_10475 [Massilia sp. Root418]|uniref:hypothetical protein n=1 Tax=Massilia sp. Root418 TaxID=1736532 RepID=UPI0006F4EA62|nr:hypothetical protein [Massilia sp. Root418]KQW97203.1 hypothetical protein ASC94_10475 [Massilia sp. Root418]
MAKTFNLAAAALLAAAAAAMSAAAPAAAQKIGQAPVGEPAVPQSHSVEQADARLAEVARDRAAVQAEYDAAEQVCNAKFFVNYCLDGVKEKRRVALAGLRAIEVEANQFKRRYAVDKRDAELAERLKKDEEELARRIENPPAPHAAREPAKPAAKPGPSLEQRQAEYDAKVKAQAAKDAAEAPKRAASVTAFEKKKAESEKRQADIAAKKAAKEEKQRKREADAAAKAAKDAADAAARAKAQ